MKIQIIKKASKTKPTGYCPVFIDENPGAPKK